MYDRDTETSTKKSYRKLKSFKFQHSTPYVHQNSTLSYKLPKFTVFITIIKSYQDVPKQTPDPLSFNISQYNILSCFVYATGTNPHWFPPF